MLKIPNDIPILLIAGTKDPVGENGEGVKALEKFLNKYLNSISMILLSGLRHEILNEIEKDQAINEIINFIDQ
jgi:alpha-beta hydrolase superfamily lysophospholipase